MSAFDLAPVEGDSRLRALMAQPEDAPGAFSNFWSAAGASLQAGPLEAVRAVSPVLDAYSKAAAFSNAGTNALLTGQPVPDAGELRRETIDRIGTNDLRSAITPELERLTPDPRVTGYASQMVYAFGKGGGKAIGYDYRA